MLKTLLGHWKANRKKPSLLPEEGDVIFEEPTTINPLFEDSDSSISSANANAGENPSPSTETNLGENLEQQPGIDRLIDLASPVSSYENAGDENLKGTSEASEHESFEKSLGGSEPNSVEDKELLSTQSDQLNKEPAKSTVSDDSPESFKGTEPGEISSDITENMRIYQPPTSAISNNRQSNANAFVPDKKEDSERLTATPIKAQNGDKEVNDGEIRKTSGILKNKDNYPPTVKNKSPPSSSESHKESVNPENLRARAIDELIKKFQNRSTENEEPDKNIGLDKRNPTRNLNRNTIVNGVTKVEQNNSSSTRKPLQKTDLSDKKNVERESLSNIFKIPPPPPLENLKQESRLHGKALAQNSNTSPEISPSNQIKNAVSKSDGAEHGTTRSDSSLERTRVASSEKTENSTKQVASSTKNEISNIVPEKTMRESFLHSPKNKEICQKKKAELEENDVSNIRTEDTTTRSVNTTDVKQDQLNKEITGHRTDTTLRSANTTDVKQDQQNKEITRTNLIENEIQNQPAHSSKDSSKSKRESSKVNLSPNTKKKVDSSIPSDITSIKNDPQSTNLKQISTEKKNPELLPVINGSSAENNPQPVSRDVSQEKKESLASEPKSNYDKNASNGDTVKTPNNSSTQKSKLKSSLSKASSKTHANKDAENTKSYSEDSGITRGDQISSEATQDATPLNDPEGGNATTNQRKSKKEKKLRSVSKSSCKKCRRNHGDGTSIKRSQYDDYYDILTGVTRSPRIRHSDSCASELSWEEKDLLRKLHALRSHRGTVRSNAPSTRSRLSKHQYIDESYFRQFHKHRPSSEESSLFSPSICSCEDCWAHYVREYSYARASLRGNLPAYQCTCRHPRSNVLGRRVKFMSDTIPEVPLPEKTTRATTPASKSDTSQPEINSDDKDSQNSSEPKDSNSVSPNPDGSKKPKLSKEEYRTMTPWELEQLDYLVRKQLLRKRRNRARCMGFIALALVIFVGLIVTILMVFLRRGRSSHF